MSLSTVPHRPQDNHLLAALPSEDYERLLPQLVPVTWALGDVLYEPDRTMAYLYFPTSAIVSLVYTMADGATAEMGMVGNEGVVGIALFMGGNTTPNRAVVQVAGGTFRLAETVLHAEFQRGGALQLALLRYTRPCSPRSPRLRSATGCTTSTSGYAGGCSSPSTGCSPLRCR